ncbi:iron-containing redox enzyme family protein [Pseudomonas sp. 15FMM2]|uniref:Iron-containing redox enzyme family protein n=1 Tax=Pseudomonas imrae TaxID=2992837 RepID=A0ACC7PKL0_9PSED
MFTNSFSQHPDIQDAAFELPVFLLGLAWFPATRFAETLGVNLALCSYLDQLNALDDEAGSPLLGQASSEQYRPLALAAIDYHLAQVDPKSHAQIATGHACALGLIHTNESRLASELMDEARFSNSADMVALIEKLGPHGCGYHKRGQLAEQPIDHWLDPQTFNAHATIQALADSRYVKAGQPEKSALMNIISNPKGRMFGVFSTADIQVVDTWIATLNTAKSIPQATHAATDLQAQRPAVPCDTAFAQAWQRALAKYSGYPLHKLYPLFLHIDKAPDALPMARHFAERWLARHRQAVQSEGLPFSPYSHQQLDLWLAAQHKRQVESYRPLTGAAQETREEIIAEAIKLAPLTLIDGAWLRNIVTPASATSPIGALLYRTLLDELGQGDTTLHHGNIYHDLLASMGVELGDFTAQSFAAGAHFDSECLQVPVFWLAISLFPKSFQPETLGLNLAMELSGVGGEYRRSADVLRHYGFSSMFTDLHNTIDNVVSGHTAWAIEAIKQHLDDVAQSGGHSELSRHWQRVWVGYHALSPPADSLLSTLRAFTQRSFDKITQRQDAS